MKNRLGRRSRQVNTFISLSLSCAALFGTTVPGIVSAQDSNESGEVEEVMVYGIRRALTDALSMKRDAENIVDTVSSEDIGALPDITIGESLARIPGVTVTSFRGRANEIAVRGLSPELTLVTINGREQTSTNAQIRNPLLIAYPSEMISRAQVYKTPLADTPEGGVAGTINLETVRPLSHDERKIAGTFRAIQNDADDLAGGDGVGFRGSISYVDQFFDNKFGLALGFVGADVMSPSIQQDVGRARNSFGEAKIANPDPDGDSGIIGANSHKLEIGTGDEDREAFLLYLQYQPNEQWDFNFDITHTKLDATIDQTDLFLNQLVGNARDGSVIADDSGLVPNIDQGYPVYYEAEGIQLESRGRSELREDDVTYGGFNVAWDPNDNWHVEFDYALTESIRERMVINARARATGVTPVMTFDRRGTMFPNIEVSGFDINDPANYTASFYREDYQDITDKSEAIRLDAEYSFTEPMSDAFSITSVEFGYRWQERSKDRIFDNEALGGGPRGMIDFAPAQRDPYWKSNALSSTMSGRSLPNEWFDFDLTNVVNQVATITGNPALDQQGGGFLNRRLGVLPFNQAGGDLANSYFYSEDTTAYYLKANIEGQLGSVPYTGGFGVRFVDTAVTARSAQGPLGIVGVANSDPNDPNSPLVGTVDTVQNQQAVREHDYTNVLPAINLTFELQEDLLLRFGAGQVIARANFGALRPIEALSGNNDVLVDDTNGDGAITQADVDAGGFRITNADGDPVTDANGNFVATITSGNPFLEPFKANQMDISLEWYFKPDAALTGTLFYKDVKSFVATESFNEDREVKALGGGESLFIATKGDVLTQDNSSGGTISGIEAGYQQQFSFLPGFWANLGFQGNYTFVKSDLTVVSQNINLFPAADRTVPANMALATVPLNNYSRHLINGQLYWEDDTYTVRLAYNFNSDEATTGRTNGTNESYADNASRFDLNLAYRLNENLRFVFEVFNLLDDTRVTKNAALGDPDVADGIYDVESRPFVESYYGRTFYAGVNFNF